MPSSVTISSSLAGIDWTALKGDLAADDFDNGRSPDALRRSFEQSQHVVSARVGDEVVGTARLLSDGVCNAYLVDVWTRRGHRHRGIGSALVSSLVARVPGQHIGLQTDDARDFYTTLGFRLEPEFLSMTVGTLLDNDGNR